MPIKKKLDWGFNIGMISSVILIVIGILLSIVATELITQNFYYAAIGMGIAGALAGFGGVTFWLTLKRYEIV